MTNIFGPLGSVPRMFRRLFTGEVIATSEMIISYGWTLLRFKAKRESRSGEVYAILEQHSSGRHEYAHLAASEVDELANLLRSLQRVVRENQNAP